MERNNYTTNFSTYEREEPENRSIHYFPKKHSTATFSLDSTHMPIKNHYRKKQKSHTVRNVEIDSVPNTLNTSNNHSNEHNNNILSVNTLSRGKN